MDVLAALHARRGLAPAGQAVRRVAVLTGVLSALPDADSLCTVSVYGSEPIEGVPATPNAYTGATTARVLMVDGTPAQVLGPLGSVPIGGGVGDVAPPGVPQSGGTATVTRAILPSVSGTYRSTRGAWGRWGDADDVYQAGSAQSGPLSGLACYGDQVVAIGAASITRAVLTLVQVGTGFSLPWSAVVRGSASGSLPAGAPSYAGDSITVGMPGASAGGATRTGELTATMCEALRTGATKSLGLVGVDYGATAGLGTHGAAWALSLTCEVPL